MSIKGFFNNWITKNIIWAVILILVLVFAAHFLLKIVTRHNKEITVPDFTNMTLSEAQTLATKYGMRVQVTDSVYVKRMARGSIYRHNPAAGDRVKQGQKAGVMARYRVKLVKLIKWQLGCRYRLIRRPMLAFLTFSPGNGLKKKMLPVSLNK